MLDYAIFSFRTVGSEPKYTLLCSSNAHQVHLMRTNTELGDAPEVQSHVHLRFFCTSSSLQIARGLLPGVTIIKNRAAES